MLEVRADELAGIEGISLGALGDEPDHGRLVGVHEVADHFGDRVAGQWFERDSEVIELAASPTGSSVEQLRPGEHDHQHSRVAARLHDELSEVEETVARPVQVLENDDE